MQALLLLAVSAPEPPPIVAVVRVTRGLVSVAGDVGDEPGHPVSAGQMIETGGEGWAELHLTSGGRVRASALTRFVLDGTAAEPVLRLEAGRVWVQMPGGASRTALSLRLPNQTAVAVAGTSGVVEYTHALGATFVTIRGFLVVFAGASGRVEVSAGRVFRPGQATDGEALAEVGGRTIAELVAQESENALGDLIGLRRFVIDSVLTAELGRVSAGGRRHLVRSDAEVLGSDAGPAGARVEEGIRPPPFFEEEVPSKGPNVSVEVSFGED